ncbi:MAG: hypothetical protein NWE91_06225 [Candidatus Bathyarchaeota archaeon]|nr:hypothetical protein [Candidatus Bathyarchaeota archaeon]
MEFDEENVASQLKGNTLRVYWHVLRSPNDTVGARETQRKLGFSSPALAVYHLDKLVDLELVEKIRGEYHLLKKVNVGILRQFIRVGMFILPRYLLYAMLFTTLLIFYTTQVRMFNFYSVFALVFGVLGTGIMWYETLRIWHQRP